jgi:hypothetical protein
MKGYVRRKGDRWYAVIYEGVDPQTGKERRSWHAAGTERADAERLAAKLAAQANGRQSRGRTMTFGAYLQSQWLPAKKAVLRPSTYAGYRRNVELHVIPTLGRIPIRRLRDKHLEELYDRLAHPAGDTRALSPKTVLEIHLIVRAALADALREAYVTRNVALSARLVLIEEIDVEGLHHTPPLYDNRVRNAAAVVSSASDVCSSEVYGPPGSHGV